MSKLHQHHRRNTQEYLEELQQLDSNLLSPAHKILGLSKTDKIKGGLADKKTPSDFDQKSLKEGTKVESEHTKDKQIAREIAMDHLTEDKKYYKKLKTIEKGEKGDWKEEGYSFKHSVDTDERMTPNVNFHKITAHDRNGKLVGRYTFAEKTHPEVGNPKMPHFYPSSAETKEAHRRKGLASKAYEIVQQKTGKKLDPSPFQTKDAKKLWENKNKSAGIGSSLKKAVIDLLKAPQILDQGEDWAESVIDSFSFKPKIHNLHKTYKLKDGKFYHVYHEPNHEDQKIHTISEHKDPSNKPLSVLVSNEEYSEDGEERTVAGTTGTHPLHQGQGHGTRLKKLAAKFHGKLYSDGLVSEAEDKSWKKLKRDKNLKTKIAPNQYDLAGKKNDPLDYEDEASEKRHVIEYKPKKLAANEKDKPNLKKEEQQELIDNPNKNISNKDRFLFDSKLKDKNGQHKVFYHGTDKNINEFQEGRDSFRGMLLSSFPVKSQGHFFGHTPEQSSKYGKNILPVHIRMTNPLLHPELDKKPHVDFGVDSLHPDKERDIADILLAGAENDKEGNKVIRGLMNDVYIKPHQQKLKKEHEDDELDHSWVYNFVRGGGLDWEVLDNPKSVNRMLQLGYDGTYVHEPHDEEGSSLFVPNGDQIKHIDAKEFDRNDRNIYKTLTAGMPVGAPSTLTGGEALQKESLSNSLEQLSIPDKVQKKKNKKNYTQKGINKRYTDIDIKKHKDKVKGGLADKKKPSDFDQKSLKEGVRVEREHTSDKQLATEIAMDHLTEDRDYYKKLKTIEKGEKGDWKREGYKFKVINYEDHPHFGGESLEIQAHHPTDGHIGGTLIRTGEWGDYEPSMTEIKPEHRRKGLATEMYRIAEKHLGYKLQPNSHQSKDAKKLWSQPNRSFGKSEFDESWFFEDDNSITKHSPPEEEGIPHPEKPWVTKRHPNGTMMWHSHSEHAKKIDSAINSKKAHTKILNSLKEPHKSAYIEHIRGVIKDPNRHFIPTNENGVEKLRARHVKSLIDGKEHVTIDTSHPDKLVFNRESHSQGKYAGTSPQIVVPIKKEKL